jgi:hypothetical protein
MEARSPVTVGSRASVRAISLLVAVAALGFATAGASEPTESVEAALKQPYVSGCVSAARQRGDTRHVAYAFCSCTWNVIASSLTIREYSDVQLAGESLLGSPVMRRIRNKLDACKQSRSQ